MLERPQIKVLLVDDEQDILELVRTFLMRSGGLEVDTALSGAEALSIVSSREYEAIVSDYKMPMMDGLELLKQVRRSHKDLVFIMYTGTSHGDIARTALDLGVDAYVKKTGDFATQMSELGHSIKQLVSKQRTEDALMLSERSVELNPLPTIWFDVSDRVHSANKAACDLFGYTRSEMLTLCLSDLDASWNNPSVLGPDGSAERDTTRFGATGRKKDGSLFEADSTVEMFDLRDQRYGFAFIQKKMQRSEDLQRSEEALRDSEAKLKDILVHAPIGMAMYDSNGILITLNEAYLDMHGIESPDDVRELDLFQDESLSIEDLDMVRQGSSVRTSIMVDFNEIRKKNLYRTSRTGMAYLEVQITPMSRGELVSGYMVLVEDFTQRKMAEIALADANRKLKILNDLTRHDLLNQLTVISGNIALVKMKGGSGEPRLEKMEKAAESMRKLLQFAKEYQTLGEARPDWQDVTLTMKSASDLLDLGRVSLIIDTEGVEIFADPLLEKAFYNLLENTLRHGDGVKNISLKAVRGGPDLALVYEDDGAGISRDMKDRLFEKGCGKNTGLGLFMIRNILGISGITVTENGIEGHGVRFEMIVPNGNFRMLGVPGTISARVDALARDT